MLKLEDELGLTGGSGSDAAYKEMRRQLGYEDDNLPFAEEIPAEAHEFLLAPAESHVQAFRLIEGGDGENSYIDVRFKPNGRSGIRQYRYTFGSGMHDAAKMVWHEMSGAAHPGVDIWAYLIRGGIPYEETAVA